MSDPSVPLRTGVDRQVEQIRYWATNPSRYRGRELTHANCRDMMNYLLTKLDASHERIKELEHVVSMDERDWGELFGDAVEANEMLRQDQAENARLRELLEELVELLTWESTATDVELYDGDWDERRTAGIEKAQAALAQSVRSTNRGEEGER